MMCRMDDPILWGILPLSYMFNPDNLRWGLGSYDLCFTNKCASKCPASIQY
jgi:monolysocardiolipin acyltransferase